MCIRDSAGAAPAAEGKLSGEGKTIGVLFDFLQVERRVLAKNYLEQYAKEASLELIFLDANGDEKVQMQQAENRLSLIHI